MMRQELLLGCGRSRQKRLAAKEAQAWTNLVTLDMNPDVGAAIDHAQNNGEAFAFVLRKK